MPRLLLADDSVTIQRVIELTFAEEGIEVVSVGDGQQAIEALERGAFDVVLADVGMPGVDGFAVAAYIQRQPAMSGLPVILLTGAFDTVDQVRVNEVKAAAVLAKPFEPQMVIAKVRELLGGAPAPAAQPPAPAASKTSPDDYFDRLDKAFASLTPTLEPRPVPKSSAAPTAQAPAAGAPVEAPPVATSAASAAGPAAGASSGLADTFATLLAVETGELPPSALLPPPEAGDEALVERVARRVVAEMGDGPLRQLATDILSRTAERLVREEIERIKAGQ